MSRQCPDCGLGINLRSNRCSCGWVDPESNRSAEQERRRFNEQALAAARARPGPTSLDLTENQWYAACKFWPEIAKRASAHCGRALTNVSQNNPLDRQVKLGPMLSRLPVDLEGVAEREAIQGE